MTKFELRCSDAEKAAWSVAAGEVPLSRWARRVLNSAVKFNGAGEAALVERVEVSPAVRGDTVTRSVPVQAAPTRSASTGTPAPSVAQIASTIPGLKTATQVGSSGGRNGRNVTGAGAG